MQLIDICTNTIALFAGLYFLTALAAHLVHCWQYPPVKPIAAESLSTVEEFNLLEVIDPCDLLLLLLPPAAELHPWEMTVEKMPEIETIAAVHQPTATPEPSAELLDVDALLEVIDIEPPSDYAQMSIRQLKQIAKDRRIPGYSRLSKTELVSALA